MKKTISILACLLLSLSAGIYYYMNQPKNIFDEIYQKLQWINIAYIVTRVGDTLLITYLKE